MTAILNIVILLALLAIIVGLIKPGLSIPWVNKPNRIKVLIVYLGVVLVCSLLYQPPQDKKENESIFKSQEKESAAKNDKISLKVAIKDMHGSISKVNLWKTQEGTYRVSVFLTENTAVSQSSLMFMLGQDMMETTRNIYSSKYSKKMEKIIFFAHSGQDNLLMKLWYNAETLENINLNNIPSQKFLSLIEKIEIRPNGKKVAAAFCRKTDAPNMAKQFCIKALK